MSLMPSLCAALERAGGERLVMRAGERPHVLAGDRRHDVASAVLSVHAVEALAEQILSHAGRQQLTESGEVNETVHSPSFPHPLTARAERVGEAFCIELIVTMPTVEGEPETADLPVTPPPPPDEVVLPVEPTPVAGSATQPQVVAPHPAEPDVAPEVVPTARVWVEPEQRSNVTVVTRVEEPVPQPRQRADETMDLVSWISRAADVGATTLYLRAGAEAAARIDERIQPIGREQVDAAVIEEAAGAFTRGGDGVWLPRPDGEWVREDDRIGYVSCRAFSDTQGTGLIVHLRPPTSLRLLHKHIPRQVRTACAGDGLVVVAASTEADVEGLAAAVADWSARERGGHLISLQRRCRLHEEIDGAFVSQRAVGGNEKDCTGAIRRAAQEGPDILLVTGLRSEPSLQAAVLAAAGGRLVVVGVVAPTTVEALRMLGGTDGHVGRALAASFRAAVGYRKLRRIGGGRTLVQDVVAATDVVCGLIEAGDFDGIARTQRDNAPGMRSVDEALARAVRRRQISLREAAGQAIDPRHMVALVRTRARSASSPTQGRRVVPISVDYHDDRHREAFGAAASMIGSSRF